VPATVLVGDAADPPIDGRTFEVVLVRHLVWTLPEPHGALRRWVNLLERPGRIVLVEGLWSGAPDPGDQAAQFDAVRPARDEDHGYGLSRRQLLLTLLALPVALSPSLQPGGASAVLVRSLLTQCAASIMPFLVTSWCRARPQAS